MFSPTVPSSTPLKNDDESVIGEYYLNTQTGP